MKKYRIFSILLIITTLLSCSSSGQDDPVVPEPTPTPTPTPNPNPRPQGQSISFGGNSGTWQNAPTSRAEAGKAGLETLFPSFRIWGYKTTDDYLATLQLVMNGYNVQYIKGVSNEEHPEESTQDSWQYEGISNDALPSGQTIKYWDFSASSYRFLGYAPSNAQASAATNNESNNLSFTIPFAYSADTKSADTYPYISELWFAQKPTDTSNDDTYGKTVTMTFAPLVAKVRFQFTYPENTKHISIKDIKFCDSRYSANPSSATTPLRGNIIATYPLTGNPSTQSPAFSWTHAAEASTGQLLLTIPYEDKDSQLHILEESQYGKWYFVPPYAALGYEQGTYTITAIIDGNYSSATVDAEKMKWQPGYQYTYTFKITNAGTLITFADVEVEQWQPGANTDNNGSGTAGW